MKKLIATVLLAAIGSILLPYAHSQTIKPNTRNLQKLGRADHLAYIDLNKLPTNIERKDSDKGKEIDRLYNSKLKLDSFFKEFKRDPQGCWAGSIPRDGVNVYCLPDLRLGYHVSTRYLPEKVERFVPFMLVGVTVFYETKSNSFYLGGDFNPVFGPFTGEPTAALAKAIKPRKDRRGYPGVKLEFLSQTWNYPDEPEPPCIVCHTAICPDQAFRERYFGITTRLRLVNKSKKSLYYLSTQSGLGSQPVPAGIALSRKIGQIDWKNAELLKESGKGEHNTNWTPFLPGAAVDIELVGTWVKGKEYTYAVLLNDVPAYWDEFHVSTVIPTTLKRPDIDERACFMRMITFYDSIR